MAYKKYDPAIKQLIIQSGKPDLFPDLNISRTTALYWIHKSKDKTLINRPGIYEDEVQNLKKQIYHQKAINLLLERILQDAFKMGDFHACFGRDTRRKVVEIVEEMKGLISIREIIKILGVSQSSYYRYRTEVLGCARSKRNCDPIRPNQLSRSEQEQMSQLAVDPKLAHLSIKSLMYYAQRENILFCGIDSWYKYLRLNRIQRPFFKRKQKKRYSVGIRANRPHEIWHIDITEIKTIKGERLYVQMIVDNFSRAIISWKIGYFKDLKMSLRTLRHAMNNSQVTPHVLMSDGGGENRNREIEKLLLGRGICQLIAKSDVFFSNSMIEAVFRQFKKNPKIYRLKSANGLSRVVRSFVNSYNISVPHSSLGGAKPMEVLSNTWSRENFLIKLQLSRKMGRMKRVEEFNKCKECILNL